jgi:hypothetical protein
MKPRAALFIIATLVALGGLYLLLRDTGRSSISYEPQARMFRLVIGGQRVTNGPTVLDATRGDAITLVVSADRPATIHLHGYERLLPVQPGSDATLAFTAARAGWFPLGLHNPDGSETDLAALQVQPQP